MTEADGPILIALALLIIIGAIVAAIINRRRQIRQDRARLTLNRQTPPGGIPFLQEGQTVHIGTPGARDRRNTPITSPLGQRVLKAHYAAKGLQDRVTIGDPVEIRDAAAAAYARSLELAEYIEKARDDRRRNGIN